MKAGTNVYLARLVPLGSHHVGAPWGGTLSTTLNVPLEIMSQCSAMSTRRFQVRSVSSLPAKVPMRNFSRLVFESTLSSPFSGCGPNAAQLDPWIIVLLWPDSTLSRVFYQNPDRSVTQSTAIPLLHGPNNRNCEKPQRRSPRHRDYSGFHHGGTGSVP